jgi:hypothetical protein
MATPPRPNDRGGPGAPGPKPKPKSGGLNLGPAPAPPAGRKQLSPGSVFNNYVNAHPELRPYADALWGFARQYDVDPSYLAALIETEAPKTTGGQLDPAGENAQQSIGLAQIHIPSWLGKKGPDGHVITQKDLIDPKFGIRFAAWYIAQGLAQGYGYDTVYTSHYNPNDPARFTANPYSKLPKSYVPRGGVGSTPPPGGGNAPADKTQQAAVAQDPWVVIDGKGNVTFNAKSLNPPKGTLQVWGAPVTRSYFLSHWHGDNGIDDVYLAYTGHRASAQDAARILTNGTSTYALKTALANTSAFLKSPVWKSAAPQFKDTWSKIMGPESQAPTALVRTAIAQNLSPADFAFQIRKRPEYLKSVEFKSNVAQFTNTYQQIYGNPGAFGQHEIQQAAIGGWDPGMFSQYLRSKPEYTSSPEYQSKALQLADALGLITGHQATLAPRAAGVGPPVNTNPALGTPLPPDARLGGTPPPDQPEPLANYQVKG